MIYRVILTNVSLMFLINSRYFRKATETQALLMHDGIIIAIALIVYEFVLMVSFRGRQYDQWLLDIDVRETCTRTFGIYIHTRILANRSICQRVILILLYHTKAINHTCHQRRLAIITRKVILDCFSILQANNLRKDVVTIQVSWNNGRIPLWKRYIGILTTKHFVRSEISIESIDHVLHDVTLTIIVDILDNDAFTIFLIYGYTLHYRSDKRTITLRIEHRPAGIILHHRRRRLQEIHQAISVKVAKI